MDLSSKKVFEVLSSKGINELFHANTVLTACSFLSNASLISRGNIEREKLLQTEQYTDVLDKRYGIWFDIFVDSVDIHNRASRKNSYGPVEFVLDSKFIEKENTGKIWVSKLNPTKWAGEPREKKWFSSIKELQDNFVKGRFDQMILLRHCGGKLPIKNYLTKIILDDPQMEYTEDKVDFYSIAYGALKLSMAQAGIDVPIEKRQCKHTCDCVSEYQADENVDKYFVPSK